MMIRFILTSFLAASIISATHAQDNGFEFGRVTVEDLMMKTYPLDTAAGAVILNEFGETYFKFGSVRETDLEYHVKIKILKPEGFANGTVRIPLFITSATREYIWKVEASTYNLVNGQVSETRLTSEGRFNQKVNDQIQLYEFTMPDVKVGSVIEYQYRKISPYIKSIDSWFFQGNIPKIRSEVQVRAPKSFGLSIALRGFLELSSKKEEPVQGSNLIMYKYAINGIPAFRREEFMTAERNFRSAVYFHSGKEWSDILVGLENNQYFGEQLVAGENVADRKIVPLVSNTTDSLTKARIIYDYIRSTFTWNGGTSLYTTSTLKEVFEIKKGNIGDINLLLIAALRAAGFSVDPLILSTRDHGAVTEFVPVLADFNYVIAKLNLNSRSYLLDATNRYFPFGSIPMRCVNGKGRVLHGGDSYWFDLAPTDKQKIITVTNVKLDLDGHLRGTIQKSFYGYAASDERKTLDQYPNEKEYADHLNKNLKHTSIEGIDIQNKTDIGEPLVVKLTVDIEMFDMNESILLFNPFLEERQENPFKGVDRIYPIDFGAPIETVNLITVTLPDGFVIDEVPNKIGSTLPNDGGRYLYSASGQDNRLTINSSFKINKHYYAPSDYHYLKELYSQMLQSQQADIVIKRK